MTMPDPLGLREFAVSLRPAPADSEPGYQYAITMTRGALVEWQSPWADLRATGEEAARAEAHDRAVIVMALVQGARVESLEPHGVGDDGQPV
jgi:hypothetical protein